MADTQNDVSSSSESQSSPESARPTRRPRPMSTLAQSFAVDLEAMFGLSSSAEEVEALSQTVEEKKKIVSSGRNELEELEARLRETEQRLAKASHRHSMQRHAPVAAPTSPEQRRRKSQSSSHTKSPRQPRKADSAIGSGDERVAARQNAGRDDYVMVESGERHGGGMTTITPTDDYI